MFYFHDYLLTALKVYEGDPQRLRVSALVSRDFYRAASPLMLRSITIPIASSGTSLELPNTCSRDLLTRLNNAKP